MNISHYGFVCQVNFPNGKYIRVKKKKFLEIFKEKNRYQVFVNYSRMLPIWWILFLFLFTSFGIHELLLFLFVQKLALRIYSYSYSREKLLLADHCNIHYLKKVYKKKRFETTRIILLFISGFKLSKSLIST